MYVEPSFRRRGIGKLLLYECQKTAQDLRLRTVLLAATDDGLSLCQ